MSSLYDFRESVRTTLAPFLTEQGYQLQEPFAHQRPPAVPADYYLPFLKGLGDAGYGHLIISHTYVPRQSVQELDVLLLRYDGPEPWEANAVPIPGRPYTNLAGYLPGPEQPHLPLCLSRHRAAQAWRFDSADALLFQLQQIQARLPQVLAWLEEPGSTQFVHVEQAWYREPFLRYVEGSWDGQAAYAAVACFQQPERRIEAGDADATYLVNVVTQLLYQAQRPGRTPRPDQLLLDYLVRSLQGEELFSIGRYRALLSTVAERQRRPPSA